MLSCYFFYPLHLYVFVLICQYYVVLLERTNKYIIYIVGREQTGNREGCSTIAHAFVLHIVIELY